MKQNSKSSNKKTQHQTFYGCCALFVMAHRELKSASLLTTLNYLNDVIAHTCISIKLVCCSEATSLILRCNLGRIDF